MCEMDSLDSDGSSPRPGITAASCVAMHNRHTFLRLGCGEMVVKVPYGLRAGMLSVHPRRYLSVKGSFTPMPR